MMETDEQRVGQMLDIAARIRAHPLQAYDAFATVYTGLIGVSLAVGFALGAATRWIRRG